eukprot:TRINITY_DN19730_c0_g1_i1.p1 TRINITY_DN19730_c0_g1~~TRINITY_DN19730_c0_g1_i1.p1  ORF type:complete len:334 (+),score=66.14 TRINITY_DN19730_c0_g1_i1:79-1080(+)
MGDDGVKESMAQDGSAAPQPPPQPTTAASDRPAASQPPSSNGTQGASLTDGLARHAAYTPSPVATPPASGQESMPHTTAAVQALIRECKAVRKMRARGELPVGIDVAPKGDDLFEWAACILGPPGTPYEGGTWNLDINFPPDYPMTPPRIRFKTPIYHPNVNPDGRICLDVTGGHTGRDFREAWSAALTIDKVLLQILAMMSSPNFDDPWLPMTQEEWRRRAPQETREKAACEKSLVPPQDPGDGAEATKVTFDHDGFAGFDEEDAPDDEEEYYDSDGECGAAAASGGAQGGEYASEVAQLRALGVEASEDAMLEVLRRCRGNVEDAFARLCD